MAAAWQASGTLLGALTTNDVTPVIPTHAVDDILICITANRVITNTCSTPANWTLLHGPIDTTAWRTYVFYRRATVTNTTNPLCDWTATSADKYAQVHTVRGAKQTDSPFAASVLSADLTDTIASTGVTSTVGNQLIIVVGIGSDNASASMTSVTGTDPTSYTQRHFSTITTGADATGWFFTAPRTNAGATGTVTQDFNSTMPAAGVLVAAMLNAEYSGATSSTYTISRDVRGFATKAGAVSKTLTFGATTAGALNKFGATSATFTLNLDVQGFATKAGASASTYSLARTVAGFATKAGALSATFPVSRTVSGFATKTAAISATYTLGTTVAGSRTVSGATSSTFAFGSLTSAFTTRFGSTSSPFVFTSAIAGDIGGGAGAVADSDTGHLALYWYYLRDGWPTN